MRARAASANSTGEISFFRSKRAACSIERNANSDSVCVRVYGSRQKIFFLTAQIATDLLKPRVGDPKHAHIQVFVADRSEGEAADFKSYPTA